MKLIVLLIALSGLACTVSPVITDPGSDGGSSERYSGCKRAAKDYCRHVVEADEDEMDRCVANSTFECLSGSGR
jgi:hypothetical protein